MTWTPNPSIAARIASSRAAARSVGSTFRLLGHVVSDAMLIDVVRDTLGIPDEAEGEDIAQAVSSALHLPVATPAMMAPALMAATIASDDALLARYLGVDPLRLLLAGNDAVAKVTRGAMSLRVIPKWRNAALEHVDISFKLARDVTWRNGRLAVRGTQLPHAVTDALVGRGLDSVHDESWEGWKRLVIQSAVQTVNTVTFDVGRQDKVTLGSLGTVTKGL